MLYSDSNQWFFIVPTQLLVPFLVLELENFQELGKEHISLLHDGAESSSCIHTGHERAENEVQKTLSKLEEAETKAENLKISSVNTVSFVPTFYFLYTSLQLLCFFCVLQWHEGRVYVYCLFMEL